MITGMSATGPIPGRRSKAWEERSNGEDRQHEGGAHRFTLVRFRDVKLSTAPPYLLKGFIPREGLVVIWGPPKCGKSFWTFDLVLHIALGWMYRGHPVKQGAIVYVSCEGEHGFGARSEAFKKHHGIDDEDPEFHLLTTRLNLVADRSQLIKDIRAQVGETEIAAIVIDTLNRSIQGSESSDEDMSDYVKAADAVKDAFKCTVILVHHCGLEGTRPRGHTSLTGAVDAQIAVSKDRNGIITVTVEHMKDGAAGATTASELKVIEVGRDDDGEALTSCVVIPTEAEPDTTPQSQRTMPTACSIALDALRQAIASGGEPAPTCNQIPAAARVVKVDLWRQYAYSRNISDKSQHAKNAAFNRSVKWLQDKGYVGGWQEFAWIASERPGQ